MDGDKFQNLIFELRIYLKKSYEIVYERNLPKIILVVLNHFEFSKYISELNFCNSSYFST